MARWPLVLLTLASIGTFTAAAQNKKKGEVKEGAELWDRLDGSPKYVTEPLFRPETLEFTYFTDDTSAISPGYIFIAPIAKLFDWGPEIYDLNGDLIFYGDNLPHIQKHVEDFKPCDYLGEKGTHLCWHDGLKRGTLGGPKPYGRKAIFDNTYKQVSMNYTYPQEKNHVYPNSHEMRPVDDGHAFLEPTYLPKKQDLRPYGGLKDGWIWDACFQEINSENGKPNFEWCFLDNYPVWETNLFFPNKGSPNITSEKAGEGTQDWPWDAFHLNAIDKNPEGDYLVSIRHLDQILKIAGQHNPQQHRAGETVWRLGGKFNEFDMGSLLFSKQHAVRSISINQFTETFSIFDNAWEGTNEPSANYSAGMIITVNHIAMTAKLDVDFLHPDKAITPSQGNMQNLANGNVIIGWGALPEITEYAHDGTPLWHAKFSKDAEREDMSYRAFKGKWVGKPYWSPKLVAYAPTCDATEEFPLVAYVSWNGATEVKQWRFYTSDKIDGPWSPAGMQKKTGFETKAILGADLRSASVPFAPYVKVDALDSNGMIIGSTNTTTFVPGLDSIKQKACTLDGCRLGFDYSEKYNCAGLCHKSSMPVFLAFVIVLVVIEILSYSAQRLQLLLVDMRRPQKRGHKTVLSVSKAEYGPVDAVYADKVGLHQS